ncbi:hypothetical protein T484DRAFT_1825651 [Baffinella frigidus]|nr:hypothetical protein T484DRAFT_1825651 [Cryptophyta sp. CCMP2293]
MLSQTFGTLLLIAVGIAALSGHAIWVSRLVDIWICLLLLFGAVLGSFSHFHEILALQGTQEVRFPGQTNRNYKIACEDCAFFVKINRHVRATEMFEREWQSLKALRFAGAYTPQTREVL